METTPWTTASGLPAASFHETAAGIPDCHLLLLPRSSHMTALGSRPAQHAVLAFLAGEEWR